MKIDKNTDLNEFTINSFESTYLKNYLYKIGHKFSLEEMVTIIWNSSLILDDKIKFINVATDVVQDPVISKNYIIKDKDTFLKNVKLICKDYEEVLNYCFGIKKAILMFFDENDLPKCFFTIEDIDKKLNQDSTLTCDGFSIINGSTSDEMAYVYLEKEPAFHKNIVSFSLCKPINGEISELYDKYIDVPNDIKVGDVITIAGDPENKTYVVVSDSTIPDRLKDISDYSVDACITVIPEDILDKNANYKQQIEDIYKKRKELYESGHGELDIICKEHDHIHLSFVEKIEARII